MARLWVRSAAAMLSMRDPILVGLVSGGELGADDRVVDDADPVCGAREGQDVEVMTALLPEGGTLGNDADRGMRAVSQREQVADLAGHHLGALHPESEGALVDDHLQQPGHAGGLVRLAMGQQVPLLVNVAPRRR